MRIATGIRRCLATLFALALAGCGLGAKESEVAPFQARLGGLPFSFDADDKFFQARVGLSREQKPEWIKFQLCKARQDSQPVRPHGCEVFENLPVDASGVKVLLFAPRPHYRFSKVKERPGNFGPEPGPLVSTPLTSHRCDFAPSGPPGECYQLSRIEGLPAGGINTTSIGWPLVKCERYKFAATTRESCVAGFAVNDVFVEARWFCIPDERDLDQSDVWSIVSAVDAAVRSRVSSQSLRSPPNG